MFYLLSTFLKKNFFSAEPPTIYFVQFIFTNLGSLAYCEYSFFTKLSKTDDLIFYQAPERITALPNSYRLPSSTPIIPKTSGMNLTKPRNEITITPVMSNPAVHQTILQQQLQRQQDSAARKFPMLVGLELQLCCKIYEFLQS